MPTRYKNILLKPSAHSDDEGPNAKGEFVIKTLPFRSANMNKFVRRVKNNMLKEELLARKTSQKHPRVLPKVPVMSQFIAPPTQLPIDCYSPAWYNSLSAGQKEKLVDSKPVALLPNAAKSLLAIPHPSEGLLSVNFNKKYYDKLIEPYQLVTAAESDDEDLERRGDIDYRKEVDDDEGEGVDLTLPSDGEEANDDEYYAEGEFGDLYDEEKTTKWIESDGSEDDKDSDYNANDKDATDKDELSDDEAVDRDGDSKMKKKIRRLARRSRGF